MLMNFTVEVILIIYFLVVTFVFLFIKKRLDFLSKKHFKNTKVEELLFINKKLIKIIFILFLIMYISGSYLILLYL